MDIIKLYIKKYPDMNANAEFGIGETYNTQKYPKGGGLKYGTTKMILNLLIMIDV